MEKEKLNPTKIEYWIGGIKIFRPWLFDPEWSGEVDEKTKYDKKTIKEFFEQLYTLTSKETVEESLKILYEWQEGNLNGDISTNYLIRIASTLPPEELLRFGPEMADAARKQRQESEKAAREGVSKIKTQAEKQRERVKQVLKTEQKAEVAPSAKTYEEDSSFVLPPIIPSYEAKKIKAVRNEIKNLKSPNGSNEKAVEQFTKEIQNLNPGTPYSKARGAAYSLIGAIGNIPKAFKEEILPQKPNDEELALMSPLIGDAATAKLATAKSQTETASVLSTPIASPSTTLRFSAAVEEEPETKAAMTFASRGYVDPTQVEAIRNQAAKAGVVFDENHLRNITQLLEKNRGSYVDMSKFIREAEISTVELRAIAPAIGYDNQIVDPNRGFFRGIYTGFSQQLFSLGKSYFGKAANKAVKGAIKKGAEKLGLKVAAKVAVEEGAKKSALGPISWIITGAQLLGKLFKSLWDDPKRVALIALPMILLGLANPFFFFPGILLMGSAIMVGGTAAVFGGVALGATIVFQLLASLVLPALVAPILIVLIGFPIAVTIILFIINAGAYVVPPGGDIAQSQATTASYENYTPNTDGIVCSEQSGTKYCFPVAPQNGVNFACSHHDYPAVDIFRNGDQAGAQDDKPMTIVAYIGGTVTWVAGEGDMGGLGLIIAGTDGRYYYYTHNQSLLVNRGDTVQTGQPIAVMDSTGNAESTQEHVHFGISKTGNFTVYKCPPGSTINCVTPAQYEINKKNMVDPVGTDGGDFKAKLGISCPQ